MAKQTGKEQYQKRKEYLKAYQKKNAAKMASRKRASRKMKCPKGQETDHKDGNAMNNNRSNLRCVSRKANRAKGARKTNKKRFSK